MITLSILHKYNISYTPFYFILFVDKMMHKYTNMYLHINYESKVIYKYSIIRHWEIRMMLLYEMVFIDNIYNPCLKEF